MWGLLLYSFIPACMCLVPVTKCVEMCVKKINCGDDYIIWSKQLVLKSVDIFYRSVQTRFPFPFLLTTPGDASMLRRGVACMCVCVGGGGIRETGVGFWRRIIALSAPMRDRRPESEIVTKGRPGKRARACRRSSRRRNAAI